MIWNPAPARSRPRLEHTRFRPKKVRKFLTADDTSSRYLSTPFVVPSATSAVLSPFRHNGGATPRDARARVSPILDLHAADLNYPACSSSPRPPDRRRRRRASFSSSDPPPPPADASASDPTTRCCPRREAEARPSTVPSSTPPIPHPHHTTTVVDRCAAGCVRARGGGGGSGREGEAGDDASDCGAVAKCGGPRYWQAAGRRVRVGRTKRRHHDDGLLLELVIPFALFHCAVACVSAFGRRSGQPRNFFCRRNTT